MRQDQWLVTVSVAGRDLGVFDKQSGGASQAEETKYREGGMGGEISLGGYKGIENVTTSRLYKEGRDHDLAHWLDSQVGKGEMIVSKSPLDRDGNVNGRPIVYRGVLNGVTYPETDSESTDAALLELEQSTNGSIG